MPKYALETVVTAAPAAERALALALHDLAWRIARLGPAEVGVTPLPATELAVLRAVIDQPDRSVSDVASAMSMQPSNVSAAVRALVTRGLVQKCPDPHDRRVTLLRPTAQALKNRESIETAIAGTIFAALANMTDEHVTLLMNAIPAMRTLATEVTTHVGGRIDAH
ncbi:MarR family winged helix-turn-helix transcriptional regulator [Mycolicibacterium mengxianglii]|uniref:MarR family winged helix-turn-helix transcriptional regulator n=1 Tax=Mycolicibacterium mengxianglii TaxID=2736649 RepID=UPI0018EEDAB9|nr:MarR family transcriptional regulator [Mycolicibacterium mengxianglii]